MARPLSEPVEVLRMGYYSCSYGNTEPDTMLVHLDLYNGLRRITLMGNPDHIGILKFMNAEMKTSPLLKPHQFAIISLSKPYDPRYNGLFDLNDLTLFKLEVPLSLIEDLLPVTVKTRFPEGAEL